MNLNDIIHGSVGIAKATTGVDRALDVVIRNRYNICKNCKEASHSRIRGIYCNLCGCMIKLKVRINKESCPINKW